MKYTAEELYQWIVEENYLRDMVSSSRYNKRHFLATDVTGDILEKEDGFYVKMTLSGKVMDELRFAGKDQAEKIHFFMENKDKVEMVVVIHEETYDILFAYGETEEQRTINRNHQVIVSMLNALNIDTKGKVKKLILETGDVLMQKMQSQNMIGDTNQ